MPAPSDVGGGGVLNVAPGDAPSSTVTGEGRLRGYFDVRGFYLLALLTGEWPRALLRKATSESLNA